MKNTVENKKELSLAQVVTALANHSTFKTENENSSYYSAETVLNALCWKAEQQVSWKTDQLLEANEKLEIETTRIQETGVRADNTSPSEVVTVKTDRIMGFMKSVKAELGTWSEFETIVKQCYKKHTGKEFMASSKGSAPKGLGNAKEVADMKDFINSLRKSA
tara:strand:+ start:91 stop:579 length:489 start_codon:yes stop_codon:yes gene_type:complete